MGKIKADKSTYALPGEAMSQQKFEQMIKMAEKGPFHSINTVKAELAKWKSRNEK